MADQMTIGRATGRVCMRDEVLGRPDYGGMTGVTGGILISFGLE